MSNELDGMDALRAKFKQLNGAEAQKIFKSAAGAGAKVIRLEVQRGAQRIDDPATRENIAKNIAQRAKGKRYLPANAVGVRVGIKGGAKAQQGGKKAATTNPGGQTYHWRFVEFGTKKMPAQPFMRPAMAATTSRAQAAFVEQAKKRLDAALRKK